MFVGSQGIRKGVFIWVGHCTHLMHFGRRGRSLKAFFNSAELPSDILKASCEYSRSGRLEDSDRICNIIELIVSWSARKTS